MSSWPGMAACVDAVEHAALTHTHSVILSTLHICHVFLVETTKIFSSCCCLKCMIHSSELWPLHFKEHPNLLFLIETLSLVLLQPRQESWKSLRNEETSHNLGRETASILNFTAQVATIARAEPIKGQQLLLGLLCGCRSRRT